MNETLNHHTTGPWQADELGSIPTQIANHNNGRIVADIREWNSDEGRANAYLIAAAPELLAELRISMLQYAAFVDQCCKGQDNRWHVANIKRAEAAIFKAEGR